MYLGELGRLAIEERVLIRQFVLSQLDSLGESNVAARVEEHVRVAGDDHDHLVHRHWVRRQRRVQVMRIDDLQQATPNVALALNLVEDDHWNVSTSSSSANQYDQSALEYFAVSELPRLDADESLSHVAVGELNDGRLHIASAKVVQFAGHAKQRQVLAVAIFARQEQRQWNQALDIVAKVGCYHQPNVLEL